MPSAVILRGSLGSRLRMRCPQTPLADPLHVQQRAEVGVVDARERRRRPSAWRGRRCRGPLRQSFFMSLAPSPATSVSCAARPKRWRSSINAARLASRPEDRLGHPADERVSQSSSVLARVSSKPISAGDALREQREAAGHHDVRSAPFARAWWRPSGPPGVSVMRLSITWSMSSDRQPFEQRDAFAQCGLESDFAAHGALGNRGDAVLTPA